MALSSPGVKKMEGTVTDVSGGAAAPPTADAGSDQNQNDLAVVTLTSAGSTAGSTFVWTLQAPDQSDQTSRLSSATAAAPTFTPLATPGVWVATLTVTKDGVSAKDDVTVRIGDADGWLRLNPNQATATYSGGNHSTVTWSDDNANWTTVTLSANTASSVNPTDYEIKWVTANLPFTSSLGSFDFKVINDETYTQPGLSDYVFGGIMLGQATTPGGSWLGFNCIQTVVNKSAGMKRSCRSANGNIAWSSSASDKDAVFGNLSMRPYYAEMRRMQYYFTEVHGSTHLSGTEANQAINQSLVWNNPLYIGIVAGRSGSTSGDKTFKYQVWYRANER